MGHTGMCSECGYSNECIKRDRGGGGERIERQRGVGNERIKRRNRWRGR